VGHIRLAQSNGRHLRRQLNWARDEFADGKWDPAARRMDLLIFHASQNSALCFFKKKGENCEQ
jgi:hypothetical protein